MTLPPEDRDLIERVLGYDADENVKTLLLTRSDLSNLLAAARAEAAPVVSAPSSPGDGWEPIETAPRDNKTAIIVLTETGRIFKATYRFCVSENEHGECDAWCVDEDDPRPDCWTEGLCWAENEDGNPSDQPAYWKPLGPLPAAPSPGGDHGA